ncbi:MAG: diguanylate cyclase [Pseudomonadota bacterium]|nr:diguanylate cyclase [Pseudomonadota bacterium]
MDQGLETADGSPRQRRRPRRLERQLSLALTALAIAVGSVVAGVLFVSAGAAHEQSLQRAVRDAGQSAQHAIASYLAHHKHAVEAARAILQQVDARSPHASRLLAGIHQAHPGLLTMIVADSQGDIVAASPTHTASGLPVLGQGHNVADRPYFTRARDGSDVWLSDVFRGRGFGDDVIVALSQRINGPQGEFAGVVQAALDLSELRIELGDTDEDPYSYAIIDNQNRAVFASSANTIKPLDSVADRDWLKMGQATPAGEPFRLSENREHDWLGLFMPLPQGWTVAVATPVNRLYQYDIRMLAGLVGLLLTILLAAWATARVLARRVALPVSNMAAEMARLDFGARPPSFPSSGPLEVHLLAGSLRRLLSRLSDTHGELQEALARESEARQHLQNEIQDREQIIQARTLELHEANMALEQLIRQDGLTGLGNRRLLDERLTVAWNDCARQGEWLALVLIDIDHFKAFNDTYGHQAGDQALKKVAHSLQQSVHRAADLAARYGGEEFCVLLPRTALSGAEQFAQTIVEAVRRLGIIHGGGVNGLVTISAGVAVLRPQAGGCPADLVAQADRALYQAKADGRDRWVCARSAQPVDHRNQPFSH